jgi:hypothetical protein
MWTTSGRSFFDAEVGHVKEEIGQIFTTCPYNLYTKKDGTKYLASVLTRQCQMKLDAYEALWKPVLLVHMNYLMGDTGMGGTQGSALHNLCKHAGGAYEAAGAVNKQFYLNMWPHFECWASAMQWQVGGAGGYWHKHLSAIATEFGIETDVPTSGSVCTKDAADYISGKQYSDHTAISLLSAGKKQL